MTQKHCEIKTQIYDEFGKLGVVKNFNETYQEEQQQSFNNGNNGNGNIDG